VLQEEAVVASEAAVDAVAAGSPVAVVVSRGAAVLQEVVAVSAGVAGKLFALGNSYHGFTAFGKITSASL
jgi:hypothetical protein